MILFVVYKKKNKHIKIML